MSTSFSAASTSLRQPPRASRRSTRLEASRREQTSSWSPLDPADCRSSTVDATSLLGALEVARGVPAARPARGARRRRPARARRGGRRAARGGSSDAEPSEPVRTIARDGQPRSRPARPARPPRPPRAAARGPPRASSGAACSRPRPRSSPATGYAEATAEAIAREAGMSKATFYEHFANKEDCILALLDEARHRAHACQLGAGRRPRPVATLRGARARAACAPSWRPSPTHPDATQTLLVEIIGAGPAAARPARRDARCVRRGAAPRQRAPCAAPFGAPRFACRDDAFAIVGATSSSPRASCARGSPGGLARARARHRAARPRPRSSRRRAPRRRRRATARARSRPRSRPAGAARGSSPGASRSRG